MANCVPSSFLLGGEMKILGDDFGQKVGAMAPPPRPVSTSMDNDMMLSSFLPFRAAIGVNADSPG